jgi:sec-independent protein translocase protein TatC
MAEETLPEKALPEGTKPDETRSLTMSIWEHVNELRKRLFAALIAFIVACVATFNLAATFIHILAVPVGGIDKLLSIEVTENLGVFMRVSLLSGFILALPILLYELMAFIAPGLTPSEVKWVYIFIPFATIMFIAGVAFTYFVMLPAAIPFLVDFLGIKTTPRLSSYIEFVTSLMFWVGVAFEMPIVVFLLAKLHFISAGMLLRGWRYAIVIIAIAAAVITPTADPINMLLLMAPLILIYFLSILMAVVARRESS